MTDQTPRPGLTFTVLKALVDVALQDWRDAHNHQALTKIPAYDALRPYSDSHTTGYTGKERDAAEAAALAAWQLYDDAQKNCRARKDTYENLFAAYRACMVGEIGDAAYDMRPERL
jgi:hypothetical protein